MAAIPKVVVARRKMPEVELIYFDGGNHVEVAEWLQGFGVEASILYRASGDRVLIKASYHYSEPIYFTSSGVSISVEEYGKNWSQLRAIR